MKKTRGGKTGTLPRLRDGTPLQRSSALKSQRGKQSEQRRSRSASIMASMFSQFSEDSSRPLSSAEEVNRGLGDSSISSARSQRLWRMASVSLPRGAVVPETTSISPAVFSHWVIGRFLSLSLLSLPNSCTRERRMRSLFFLAPPRSSLAYRNKR